MIFVAVVVIGIRIVVVGEKRSTIRVKRTRLCELDLRFITAYDDGLQTCLPESTNLTEMLIDVLTD